jgi:hypothetical protein
MEKPHCLRPANCVPGRQQDRGGQRGKESAAPVGAAEVVDVQDDRFRMALLPNIG